MRSPIWRDCAADSSPRPTRVDKPACAGRRRSMLDAIDTGYEGKFDFAGRQPETAYLLATVPRTGSTFLSHLLWRSGCLGAPLEYLNFEPSGPFAFAASSPGEQRDLWQRLLWRRTSP